jgi:DNA (cytosine-5)-methyltransferase 1
VGVAVDGAYEAFAERYESIAQYPMGELLEDRVDRVYDFTQATRTRIKSSKRIANVIDGVEVLWNQEGGRRMGYTVYGINGAAPTLTSTSSRHYERFKVGRKYRRLTPTEYARLQGFPDNHCDGVANATRYILLGNAVPPPLAEWGLSAALGALRLTTSVSLAV